MPAHGSVCTIFGTGWNHQTSVYLQNMLHYFDQAYNCAINDRLNNPKLNGCGLHLSLAKVCVDWHVGGLRAGSG
ncbi:MAG: hypothetical protein MJE68_15195 [Proteobacteria bacterium]|nr:hypothetical protein [Pseudomonadota bacterium]